MSMQPNTVLGRYKIRSVIGAGGMGEVFLAEDSELERLVALKVLPAEIAHDDDRVRRFVQEAKAASALNHPNILTVYEIGNFENSRFIATEYIEGETLREHRAKNSLRLEEILNIAVQAAEALAAAHAAGIVHRDIKPENIMLRRDGYVKVLDFGLAKLTENKYSASDADAPTQKLIKTNPGAVMGTAAYMSPEQVRGKEIDARTDIWSFGVVLYEMLAGRTPFEGETASDIIAAVLKTDPPPLVRYAADIPTELEHIVGKTLRKDRERRYQHVKDLLIDLKDLRRDLEFEARMGQSDSHATDGFRRKEIMKDAPAGKPTAALQSPSTISEMFLNEARTHPKGVALALAIIALATAAVGVGLYKLINQPERFESFQTMRLAKLTSTATAAGEQITVSPDGKYVAYVIEEGGRQSLWVKHVATSVNTQIVAPAEVEYKGLTFSRDGNRVYYSILAKKGLATLYQVPVVGGNARKLVEDAVGPITFSPDGSRIAFVRGDKYSSLMVANADGSAAQTLAAASDGKMWYLPAWSPDGNVIISAVYSPDDNKVRLVEVAVKDGTVKPLSAPAWVRVSGMAWLSDGGGLILSGRDAETRMSQVWLVSYPEGKPRRITNDLSSYQGLSLTADGKTLVSVQQERLSNIWIATTGADENQLRKITFEQGKAEGQSGIAFTPDGKIVYTVETAGLLDLWIVNADGGDNRQLTFSARNFSPASSPDGRFIVFASDRAGNTNLWRMETDGGNPTQLTDSPGIEGEPGFSPDGKWIVYQLADTNNRVNIWKISIDGGSPIRLTDVDSGKPQVSPDGRFIVCDYGEAKPDAPVKLAVVPFDGGQPTQILDLPQVVKSRNFRWTADGRALIYVDSRSRVYNLWSQPLDNSPPKQLTDFKSDRIFRFDVSRDGKNFALARGREGSDVVMISDFR